MYNHHLYVVMIVQQIITKDIITYLNLFIKVRFQCIYYTYIIEIDYNNIVLLLYTYKHISIVPIIINKIKQFLIVVCCFFVSL